jgi:hypothetical protein
MRDIYLIDFENVASEGLSGITYLSEEDQVVIFYSNNSNRLSMKMHILIGKSICKLSYFEVSVGGKNALDHQIATWLGYLIGTGAAERNYYIVSRDMGYKHVASFWASSPERAKVRCIENIRAAGRLERRMRERREERPETAQPMVEETQTETQDQEQASMVVPTEAPENLLPILPVEPVQEPEAAEVQTETVQPETEDARQEPVEAPMETEEAQQAEPEAAVQEPAETYVPEAALVPSQLPETPEAEEDLEAPLEAAEPQGDPEDKPPKRSYRSRTKFRRGRAKYRESQPEQTEAKPQETQEAPATPELEPEAKQKKGTRTQPKREKRPAKDEGKAPKNLDQLGPLLAPYPKLQESALRELILANKRQVLCNTLRKQLGQEKGLALYNEIKKLAWH